MNRGSKQRKSKNTQMATRGMKGIEKERGRKKEEPTTEGKGGREREITREREKRVLSIH